MGKICQAELQAEEQQSDLKLDIRAAATACKGWGPGSLWFLGGCLVYEQKQSPSLGT